MKEVEEEDDDEELPPIIIVFPPAAADRDVAPSTSAAKKEVEVPEKADPGAGALPAAAKRAETDAEAGVEEGAGEGTGRGMWEEAAGAAKADGPLLPDGVDVAPAAVRKPAP